MNHKHLQKFMYYKNIKFKFLRRKKTRVNVASVNVFQYSLKVIFLHSSSCAPGDDDDDDDDRWLRSKRVLYLTIKNTGKYF